MRYPCAAAATVAILAGQALGQGSYSYTGPAGGSWHTAANWNPNGVPGVGPATGASVLIQSSPVALGAGTIPLVSSLQASQTVVMTNGVTVSGDGSLTGMDMRGTDLNQGLVCSGILTLSGNTIWRGGIIDASDGRQTGLLTIGGVGGTGPTPTARGVLRNSGAVVMSGRLILDGACIVTNEGAWDIGSDIDYSGSPSVLFRNIGNATRNGPGQAVVRASFEHTGSLSIDQGVLVLQGADTAVRGTVTLANNGTLRIWQGLPPGSPPTLLGFSAGGQGDVVLAAGNHIVDQALSAEMSVVSPHGLWIDTQAGTVTLNAGLTNRGYAQYTSGRLAGPAPFTNAAGAIFNWGSGGSTGAQLAGILINNGTVLMAGAPRLDFGTVLNGPGGLLDVTFGAYSEAAASSNQVLNDGRIEKGTGSSLNTIMGAPVQMRDGGLLRVRRAAVLLNRGSTWNGHTAVQLGSDPGSRVVMELSQHEVQSGVMTIQGDAGRFEVSSSASLTVSGGSASNTLTQPNSEVRISGLLSIVPAEGFLNTGTMRLAGGIIDAGASEGLANAGVFFADAGTLTGDCGNHALFIVQTLSLGIPGGQSGVLHNGSSGQVLLTGNSGITGRTARPSSTMAGSSSTTGASRGRSRAGS
jgi:filamentous hemagglutinin